MNCLIEITLSEEDELLEVALTVSGQFDQSTPAPAATNNNPTSITALNVFIADSLVSCESELISARHRYKVGD